MRKKLMDKIIVEEKAGNDVSRFRQKLEAYSEIMEMIK